ncbi:baseplate J/gp47 family protein [Marinomonas sp. RSW2]|uniref:Baseplate J/gp47 family protein n=1 Tax=Marinomonas maritima TaxID=2940935 RepID=A0ABT5WGF4_9GAMM|nr:baseplate J/gp47 family protein [Marinomonas maritima]MDE8603891.1 baseplate J/gp47 family protein [Marinomonas maritima]
MADFERFFTDQGIPTTEDGMKERFKQIVIDEGSTVSNDSRYSPFWRVVSAIVVTPAMWLLKTLISNIAPQFYLKTAKDAYLDDWSANYDVERKIGQPTLGMLEFHRYDTTQTRTIVAGTAITTLPINNIVYSVFLVEDLVFEAGTAYKAAQVSSVVNSSDTNLAAGYFSQIDEAGMAVDHGENWITQIGVSDETDDELRERVRLRFNRLSHYHTDGVYRSIISEATGVPPENVYFQHDAPRGPGTANAYILFPLASPQASVLTRVNKHIREDGHHGHGDDVMVFEMPRQSVNITATAFIANEVIELERERMKAEITQAIRAAFRENAAYSGLTLTHPNSRFSFTRLAGELIRIFPDLDLIEFDNADIYTQRWVPSLNTVTVTVGV